MQDFDAARQLYETKGFAHRVGWGFRPAVLVIDLTNGFTDPASPVGADLSEVIGETKRLLAAARTQPLVEVPHRSRVSTRSRCSIDCRCVPKKGDVKHL